MRVFQGITLSAFAILTSLSVAQPALAQGGSASQTNQTNQASKEDNGIGIGVEGMLTRTSVRADDTEDFFKSKAGSGFGLWIGGNKNGLVGFTGEFIYLTRKVDAGGETLKTRALEIPAVFHINVGSRSRNGAAVYGVVGPVFTINLKQTLAGVDISDNFNGADIGVIGGAGVEVFRVSVEARGNWGLRNISDDGEVGSAKTFSFELLGKFRFN